MNDDRFAGLIGYHIFGVHEGRDGIGYDYIMAGNGLFIEALGEHITARIPVAEARVRGLPLLQKAVLLEHGKIPQRFFDLALSVMLASPEIERYVGITWNNGYQLYVPEQSGSGGRVEYRTGENVVVEVHSHCEKGPGFSSIDDRDEQGFRVYGVIGDLFDDRPCVEFRLGIYGYFMPLLWGDVFEGALGNVDDAVALMEKENEK